MDANDHLLSVMDRISRLLRGRIAPEWQTVEAADVVEQAAAGYRALPNARIVLRLPEGETPVRLDKSLVVECLTNLIDNALDAMNGKGEVTVAVVRKRWKTVFSVADTGPGMDPLTLASAAEPFASEKSSDGHHFGLGLYYVRRVMDAHRGRLRIVSAPGKGTTVSLEFPNRRPGMARLFSRFRQ